MARKKSRRKVGTRFTVQVKGGKKACMVQTAKGPRFTSNRTKTGSCKRKRSTAKKKAATTAASKSCSSSQLVRRGRTVTVGRTPQGKFCSGPSGRTASAPSAPSGPISVDRLGRYRRGGRRISTAAAEAEMNPASSFGADFVVLKDWRTSPSLAVDPSRGKASRVDIESARGWQPRGAGGRFVEQREASENPFESVFTVPGVFKL